eukprot:TRINITY_DN13740_c0_g1_i1.p2 TRINITY_DN13740_c0_g1~~TRINITY_DN13740_c0_g1_i1.p2  ORF type:complete len:230 (-),score=61.87 TRINITY_DN13740_c0_g1_i1:137-826(-)
MGQSLDVLGTCDGADEVQAQRNKTKIEQDTSNTVTTRRGGEDNWGQDATVSCQQLESAAKHAVATANRGGPQISAEVMLNHQLLAAARQGDVRGLAEALEKGAWVETRKPLVMKPQKGERSEGGGKRSDEGMTPLMFSAQYGSADCVRRLVWANANINATEEDGWTPLHFAAKEGHLDICQNLLTSKADAALTNADEQTALQVAEAADAYFAKKFANVIKKHQVAPAEK